MTSLEEKPFSQIGVHIEHIKAKKLREVIDKEMLN